MFLRLWQRVGGASALAVLLVLGAGCGLTDYEARLEVQQKRLKYLEDESKNLNDRPLGLSDRALDVVKDYKQFYLRLPAGIANDPGEKPQGLFDVYPSPKPDSGFDNVLLAVTQPEDENAAAKFKKDVQAALFKTAPNAVAKTIPRPFEKSLTYDCYQGQNVLLYVTEGGKFQVAIAFHPNGSKDAKFVDERIQYCLASFADGKKAASKPRTGIKKTDAEKKREK